MSHKVQDNKKFQVLTIQARCGIITNRTTVHNQVWIRKSKWYTNKTSPKNSVSQDNGVVEWV